MQASFARLAVVLGLLSAIGPFAIDMYLPALPAIAESLRTDPHAVQWSLMSFFVAFALSQIVYGPASDILGRKPPLYLGIVLFIAGSIGCALAPDIGWLVAFRFLQGIGGGAPIVVPRAVVRDLHTGAEAARLTSMLMLVFSTSPILAPLIGSLVIEAAGWRAIFWAVTGIGVVGLLLAAFTLAETRPAADRVKSDVWSSLRAFRMLLKDGPFMGLTAIGGFGMAAFFVYLGNSSFILIQHYGLSPRQYSLCFAANAAAFFSVSQLTGWLVKRFGLPAVIQFATAGFAASMVVLWGLQLAGAQQLWLMVAMLFCGFGFLGLVVPTTSVMALDDHGEIAGAASALMGTLQLVLGALVIAVSGAFLDGTPLPMVAGIAIASLVALASSWLTLGRRRVAVTA